MCSQADDPSVHDRSENDLRAALEEIAESWGVGDMIRDRMPEFLDQLERAALRPAVPALDVEALADELSRELHNGPCRHRAPCPVNLPPAAVQAAINRAALAASATDERNSEVFEASDGHLALRARPAVPALDDIVQPCTQTHEAGTTHYHLLRSAYGDTERDAGKQVPGGNPLAVRLGDGPGAVGEQVPGGNPASLRPAPPRPTDD